MWCTVNTWLCPFGVCIKQVWLQLIQTPLYCVQTIGSFPLVPIVRTFDCRCFFTFKVGKGAHEPKAHTAGAYTGFRSMRQVQEYCYSPLDRMLVHPRITPPSSMSPVPIYTPGCRETKWSKVPCLRKQHDRRGLNPGGVLSTLGLVALLSVLNRFDCN